VARKYYTYLVLVLLITVSLACYQKVPQNINSKLIRFHVIANSDSTEDQELKLRVRDEILKEIGPKLETSKSREQSENILKENIDLIKSVALKEIKRNGSDYNVSVALGVSSFPVKMYSDIALPAGEYEALKVVIGNGEGKNWWCVMFPPLCFIDITHGITSDMTEDRLKTVLNQDEFDSILNSGSKDKLKGAVKKPIDDVESQEINGEDKQQKSVEVRFKSIEIAKSIYKKITNR